jgi:uncharacterized protein (DUF1499 family)
VSLRLLLLCSVLGATLIAGALADPLKSTKDSVGPCPSKPNCVSSRAPEGPRRIDPIRYEGSAEDARRRLLEIVRTFPRVIVAEDSGNYLRLEVRSAFFSFVDDVEFEFDDPAKLIHCRSASRLGYYDFRVNRRRMEPIIRQFSGESNTGARREAR